MAHTHHDQVIIQPCGHRSAFLRYLDTVASPVALGQVQPYVSSAEYEKLVTLFPTGSIRLWGISRGNEERNFHKWASIQVGAFVLFSGRIGHQLGRSDIFSFGNVKYKLLNRDLSLELWGLGDAGEAWECLLLFDEIKILNFAYEDLNKLLNYKRSHVVRGLTLLTPAQSRKVIASLELDQGDFRPESSKEDLLAIRSEYPVALARSAPRLHQSVDAIELPAAPAYFTSLTLENVRCFGPVQTLGFVDSDGLPAQWTIIIGDNGVGKTTLLQCLAALLPIESAALANKTNFLRAAPRYITDEALRATWKPYRGGSRVNILQLRCTFSVGAELNHDHKGRKREVYAVWTKKGYQFSTVRQGELDVFCVAYSAARRLSDPSLSEKTSTDPTANLFDETVDLLDAEEWLLKADYATKSSDDAAILRQQLERIKEALLKILPYVESIRIGQVSELYDTPAVEFSTPYGWVSLRDLSLGYKTSVAWMVDLASRLFERYPNSHDPLSEPAIVLIDELDLHLHPKLQRELVNRLTAVFPKVQFIATAHSPLIVQSAVDANLVLLKREENHVVVDDDATAVRNWRIDQVFTSELFDIPSSRPRWMDNLLAERESLLAKPDLTENDLARVKEIENQIGVLPTETNQRDVDAIEVIRRAAEFFKSQGVN